MIKPSLFEIDSEVDGTSARIVPSGELDLATAPQLERAVQSTLAELERAVQSTLADSVRDVTIDLGQLTFVDSSGLRLLITLNDRSLTEGWTLRLTAPSEQARPIFKVSGVDDHLPFMDTEDST